MGPSIGYIPSTYGCTCLCAFYFVVSILAACSHLGVGKQDELVNLVFIVCSMKTGVSSSLRN
jgi:hypothetical protein